MLGLEMALYDDGKVGREFTGTIVYVENKEHIVVRCIPWGWDDICLLEFRYDRDNKDNPWIAINGLVQQYINDDVFFDSEYIHGHIKGE